MWHSRIFCLVYPMAQLSWFQSDVPKACVVPKETAATTKRSFCSLRLMFILAAAMLVRPGIYKFRPADTFPGIADFRRPPTCRNLSREVDDSRLDEYELL